jgi:hypothetical protein
MELKPPEAYQYQLVDDGTLDTVFNVWDGSTLIYEGVRFVMPERGMGDCMLDGLGMEAIEIALDMLSQLED